MLEGSLAELAAGLTPETGIAGVRQLDDSGALIPTMRLFPSASRALGDSLGLERFPRRPDWLGERELRLERYDREFEGDWTIGSFLLVRREAFDAVGGFDERFFLYSEEVDLCLRVQRAGWKVVHSPAVTILHHGNSDRPADPRLQTQLAWARLQYADKNLPAVSRPVFRGALLLRYGLRSLHGEHAAARGRAGGDRAPPRPQAAAVREPQAGAAAGRAPCAGPRAGRDRRHRRLGHAGAGGDRAARRDVRRLGPEPLAGRARLRRVLRPLGRARARARGGRRAASAGRPPARARPTGRPWGWKEPRSVYLLPFLAAELPGLRFLHVVRDGRDMAFSENQVQLRKHGDAVLGASDEPEALRSIALWREVNLRAADFGERELGDRYLRIRFEDLCARAGGHACAEVLRFFGLDGDAERIAAEEVQAPADARPLARGGPGSCARL